MKFVWVEFSKHRLSRALINLLGLQDLYKEECLNRRLVLFIKKHQFHLQISSLSKNLKTRPIEKFWSIIKSRVYKNYWSAKHLNELEKRIVDLMKNISENELELNFKKA